MNTTQNIEDAVTFPSLRLLVEAVNRLRDAGLIDGYAIKRNSKGSVMGVRVGDKWSYLAT